MIACILTGLLGLGIGSFGTWIYLSIVVVGEALDEERSHG